MRKITSSPHIHSDISTKKIMLNVVLALTPAWVWGVYVFGIHALLIMFVSVAFAVLSEFLLGKISKKDTVWDCSALVTGVLVGMNMPPTVPLFIPALASVFAIFVVKWTFGGLGHNWANPAICGRIFVFFSFTAAMSKYIAPRTLVVPDAIGSASPLSITKTVVAAKTAVGANSFEILSSQGYPYTNLADKIANFTGLNPYNIDAFLGNISGSIGEVSKILLLIGGIYLLVKKIITWYIPVSYLGSFAVLTWIFGGIPNGLGLCNGEVLTGLLSGGIILGAFFMATDMVTTPFTKPGHLIFGIGCGFFTFLFRSFGSLPEGCTIAILLMNMFTPTIDKYSKIRKFGDSAGKKKTEVLK